MNLGIMQNRFATFSIDTLESKEALQEAIVFFTHMLSYPDAEEAMLSHIYDCIEWCQQELEYRKHVN